ncbi:predicted protein [Streptomyces albidoflavus]|nr:predicted protein [Streptomyces albidoflavus]
MSVDGHSTKPPARYTEASLVKELEEREIGRPSTYASILGTILDRGYVFKKGTALVPSFLSFADAESRGNRPAVTRGLAPGIGSGPGGRRCR